MPIGRIIMRIPVSATSAMFMHIDAHLPMPAMLASWSAHIVAAIEQAFIAMMHSCIIAMSMSMGMSPIDMDFIISIVSTALLSLIRRGSIPEDDEMLHDFHSLGRDCPKNVRNRARECDRARIPEAARPIC